MLAANQKASIIRQCCNNKIFGNIKQHKHNNVCTACTSILDTQAAQGQISIRIIDSIHNGNIYILVKKTTQVVVTIKMIVVFSVVSC